MIGGILVIILTSLLAFSMINSLKRKYTFLDAELMVRLFFYHLLLAIVYYLYALFNPSDSWGYYLRVNENAISDHWFGYYGTSTTFITFIGYPFIKFFGFSYEACMALFAFFGFIGFLFFYVFFKERIRFRHTLFGFDLLTIFFFLPNLHFWSSSFGKGSVIFLGLGLFFYGISKLHSRWLAVVIGGIIIYHVRPHVMLIVLISSAMGFMFSTKGVSISIKAVFLLGVGIALYFIYADVLKLAGIEEEQFVTQSFDLTHRATELTKATSGVDITSYSLPMQVFTFLYRPLFFDAPGVLGFIVSFENAFYLLITLKIFNLKGIRYLITSSFLAKTCLFSFLTITIALAQISGNLGLAMRQKSQAIPLFLFVIISFMDAEKMNAYRAAVIRRIRKTRLGKRLNEQPVE
jgi:hypothetical protein